MKTGGKTIDANFTVMHLLVSRFDRPGVDEDAIVAVNHVLK